MPLTRIQIDILRLLASQRDPESYVAGATALNLRAPRYSGDIDFFHDVEDRVGSAALSDTKLLEAAGFNVRWTRRLPAIYSAEVSLQNETTKLEWVVDSDFRFFPTMPDELFGYVLHPFDLATNKVMAAAGRREVRDLIDTVTIHETILPLGAVIWAAVEKAPGYNPEGLTAEIRRNSNYPPDEWRAIVSEEPIVASIVLKKLRAALDEADAFFSRMPTDRLGLLFFENGKIVQPDPERLDTYQTHAGKRGGHWPSSSEIYTAMLERYSAKAKQ